MKATKEFFEFLREDINASSLVVNEKKEALTTAAFSAFAYACPPVNEKREGGTTGKLKVVDLFSGVDGLDLSNTDLLCAFRKVETEMNVKDAEIENLKAQLRTRASELVVMKSQLEMQRIENEARELGVTPEDQRNPLPIPPEVRAQLDAEIEEDISHAEDEPEDYSNELIQMLEEAKQREKELIDALEQERKRHVERDGIERLSMTAFISYAEEYYPADQNPRAKVLKEALADVFNIRKIDDDTYERWKRLGTKESFEERMAEGMKQIAERPQMKDNNGIVTGGNFNANLQFTNEQVEMLIKGLALNEDQKTKLLTLTTDGNNNTR